MFPLPAIREVSRDVIPSPALSGAELLRSQTWNLFSNNSHINSVELIQNTVTTGRPLDHLQSLTKGGFHCGHGDLLGPLGLLVQGILAVIAFASLIGK